MARVVRIYGYHGTSREAAARILAGEDFRVSGNWYDWLGEGVYFWQDAPRRAWEWARERHGDNAAVVGATISFDPNDCIDLLDTRHVVVLRATYQVLRDARKQAKQRLPMQRGGAHGRDRAVVDLAVGAYHQAGKEIRAVRGAFREGKPIFPQSALFDQAHVQIAVRDTGLIEERWREPPPSEG